MESLGSTSRVMVLPVRVFTKICMIWKEKTIIHLHDTNNNKHLPTKRTLLWRFKWEVKTVHHVTSCLWEKRKNNAGRPQSIRRVLCACDIFLFTLLCKTTWKDIHLRWPPRMPRMTRICRRWVGKGGIVLFPFPIWLPLCRLMDHDSQDEWLSR